MPSGSSKAAIAYWFATGLLFIGALAMMMAYAPIEPTFGPVQKIFYLHLPAAISTFLAAFVVFISSIGYLWHRDTLWDDLAAAAANVTVLFCSVVLLTGMVWGRSEWGQWWIWSPRLTFSLILWLLFVGYILIRKVMESPQKRATISAVYGLAAFVDVPLVYVSVEMMLDIHPTSIPLEPAMKLTLMAWFLPVFMLAAGLVVTRYRLNRRIRAIQARDDENHHAMVSAGEPA